MPKTISSCAKCSKPAVITLKYAGISLCQSHFTDMFESRVKRMVREQRMLAKGDRVAVGLSGGKDSCVMLHLLHRISESLPFEIFAITIDEGIAGYRNKSLEVAKEQCKKLGVSLEVVSFKKQFGNTLDALLKMKGEQRSCTYCGVMRRNILNKVAREKGATKVAIGHNADDVAQTVMMNLMRNEPERLARFGPVAGALEGEGFVPRIKPLFSTPERDVAAYAIMKGIEIEFMECPYARFAFRQHVRKMLNETEEKYPGTKLKMVNSFLSQMQLLRDGLVARHKKGEVAPLEACQNCGEPSSKKYCNLCTLMMEKS